MRMTKRHVKMCQRILAMLKAEPDYESINEIRNLNDGGSTGAWHIALLVDGKRIKTINVSMRSIYSEPEHFTYPDEYYDTSKNHTNFC